MVTLHNRLKNFSNKRRMLNFGNYYNNVPYLCIDSKKIGFGTTSSGSAVTKYNFLSDGVPFGIDTTTPDQTSSDLKTLDAACSSAIPESGIYVSPSGTRLYCNYYVDPTHYGILEFSMTAAYDLSTIAYKSSMDLYAMVSALIAGGFFPNGIWFSSDGTHVIINDYGSYIVSCDFSVGWDLTTANNVQVKDVSAHGYNLGVSSVSSDGKHIFISGDYFLININLSSGWDVSSFSDITNVLIDGTKFGLAYANDFTPTAVSISGNDRYINIRKGGSPPYLWIRLEMTTPGDITTLIL